MAKKRRAKKTSKKTTKKTTRKIGKKTAKKAAKKAARKSAPSKLGSMSVSQLEAEIRRRQRGLGALEAKRDTLLGKLADVEAQISELGGSAGGGGARRAGPRAGSGGTRRGGGPRPKNSMSLVEALEKTLSGKEMSVTEAAQAVQKAGYKTVAANFRVIVNQALLSNKQFKKVARGVYTAK